MGGLIEQTIDLIVIPSTNSAGTVSGFRTGDSGFGSSPSETFGALGVSFRIVRLEQQGTAVRFAITPCPDTWELHSLIIGTEVVTPDDPACIERVATWSVNSGVTAGILAGSEEIPVVMRVKSLFISDDVPGGSGGQRHDRGGIKENMCALPDMILGDGYCGPLMVFIPPLIIIAILVTFGFTSPLLLGGIALSVMTGMGIIVLPGPVMIAGFAVASAGTGVAFMIARR